MLKFHKFHKDNSMKLKSLVLCVLLTANQNYAVGTEEILLADIVQNGVEQIKKFNDQIKLIMDQVDYMERFNKTLNNMDNVLFESGEKIFNPVKTAQQLFQKMEALEERIKNYPDKFQNAFSYDRFFKDYHIVACPTEYTTIQNKEFETLSKQTGIKIEDLKIRQCIQDNLTKATTQRQKDALKQAMQEILQGNYDGAKEQIKIFEDERKAKFENINTQIAEAGKSLNDIYLNTTMIKDSNGLTQKEALEKELRTILQNLKDNTKSQDIVGSIGTTNALLMNVVLLMQKIYQGQVEFFNAYTKLQIALHTKEVLQKEEIQKLRENSKNIENNPYLEDLKNNRKMQYDKLGIPTFGSIRG